MAAVILSAQTDGVMPPRTWSLAPVPASNVGFVELGEVTIQVPAGGPWSLRIDDEPIAPRDGAWHWKPGFYAGEVTAQLLTADDRVTAQYLLDVAPDPEKLGRTRFEEMLKEVIAEAPSLVLGDEPATILLGNGVRLEDPLAALLAFARLRAYAPHFVRALAEAARQPRMTIRRLRGAEPPHRVRRIDVTSVHSLARAGALAEVIDGSVQKLGHATRSILIDVPITEHHVDCAANRTVLALIHSVRQRARDLRLRLSRLREHEESATRTDLAARLPARLAFLDQLEGELGAICRRDPWRLVSRAEVSAAGLNAVSADPLYARAYQTGWRALRLDAGADSADDRLWLSPSWELFERWCFVRLGRMLRERLPALAWKRRGRGEHPSGASAAWSGTSGSLAVNLLLQPTFRAGYEAALWGFASISREREPDIVITCEAGDERDFYVLDAKYRRTRSNVLEAMASAHIYHDSLRWHGRAPQLAILLLPAPSEVSWLADPAFHAIERVGTADLQESLPAAVQAALAKWAGHQCS